MFLMSLRRMAAPKLFSVTAEKPVTTSSTPDEREPATGFALFSLHSRCYGTHQENFE